MSPYPTRRSPPSGSGREPHSSSSTISATSAPSGNSSARASPMCSATEYTPRTGRSSASASRTSATRTAPPSCCGVPACITESAA